VGPRFLNADALFAAGNNLTGTNMFAYCLNNPVMFSDPSGYVTLGDKLIVAYVFELIGIIINNESGVNDYLSSALNADLDSSYIISSSIDNYGLNSYTVHLGGFDFDAAYFRVTFEAGNYDARDKKVAHTENSLATKIFSNGLFKLVSGIVGEISPTKGKWVEGFHAHNRQNQNQQKRLN
jgi:hypothetical protein